MTSIDPQARRLVEERGWTVVPVDGPDLHWAYTIRLNETLGTPDLIAFGPAGEAMARLLMNVRQHLQDARLQLSDGLCWDGLGFEVCWRRVHESQYLGFNWFYIAKEVREHQTGERKPVDCLQMFMPDHAGRYPWEPDCAEAVQRRQPLLYLPLDVEPRTARALAANAGV